MEEESEDEGEAPDHQAMRLEELLLQMQRSLHNMRHHDSLEDLCTALKEQGCLKDPAAQYAFESVDRKHFLPEECLNGAYIDSPVKHGCLHQSAPSIYAQALDILDLRPGQSFLNIGSGSGYFSALVAQVIGPDALHVGVERHEELVRHAAEKCEAVGLQGISFICGNCYRIDVARSMKFDRIYVGAGACQEAKFLFKLLKPNGLCVGPFSEGSGAMEPQSLIKVRNCGDGKFAVTNLLQVQFACLVRPLADGPTQEGTADDEPVIISGPKWGRATRVFFPEPFQRTVMLLYWMNKTDGTLPSKLPWELWTRYIVSMLPIDAFDPAPYAPTCAGCGAARPAQQCGRCKKVNYCGRDCQRKHWRLHRAVCVAAVAEADAASER